MKLHLLVTEYHGRHKIEATYTQAEMDAYGDRWADAIKACREEVASDNPLASSRFGVIVLDVPDGDVEAAFIRAERGAA